MFWKLLGVFVGCFGAATLLPGVSEVGLGAMIVRQECPVVPLVVVATLGNWLGSVFTYAVGYLCGMSKLSQWLRMSEKSVEKMRRFADRYGAYGGLAAWVPVVGDPLVACMGLVRTPVLPSCITMLIGKAVRYAVIAIAALYCI